MNPARARRKAQGNDNDAQEIRFPQAAMLEKLSEAIACPKDDAIEVLLRQSELAADRLSILIVEIETDQNLPVPGNGHLLEHPPRGAGPLRPANTFPFVIDCRSRQVIESLGAR
jgi:hypothetical protein